jgi:hypothetical protein
MDDGDPIGYKVLSKGTQVDYADGTQLGTVDEVRDNAREHIFDGLVVSTDGGPVFVDAPEVERIFERRVILNVDSSTQFEAWRTPRGPIDTRGPGPISRLKRLFSRD